MLRTCLGMVQPAEVIARKQLAFTVESKKVVVSFRLDADCQEVSSQTPSRATQQRENNMLPERELLDDFPGTAAEKKQAERIFQEYTDGFIQEGEELGCTSTMHHRIHTEDDLPVNQRHRCIPPNQFEEVKEHLQDLLEKGVIRPSQSDYASPIVLVCKKSRALLMCVDYRRLNANTRKDAYPLSRIDESLDALGGARYFSAIHRMQIWRTTWSSPGTSHESEASEASVFWFDNASPEKSCFVDGLVCFISLCLLVFVFLNASRRDRNCPTFASTGKQWIHGIR